MKRNRFLLFILILNTIIFIGRCYPQSSTFTKFFNYESPYVYSVTVNSNGDFLILGGTATQFGSKALLIKADNNGNEIWSKYLGGDNENTNGKKVIADKDGNYIICGVRNTPSYRGNTPDRLFISKLNSNGDSLWQKVYNNTKWNQQAEDMILSDDEGLFVSGTYSSDSVRGFLFRFNSVGDSLWEKYYKTGEIFNDITSIQQTDAGEVLMLGYQENNTPFIWDRYESFFIRTGPEGTILKQIRLHEDSSSVSTSQIVKMSDGNFAFLTYSYSFITYKYLTKLEIIDAQGNILLDNIISADNSVFAVAPSQDNCLFLANKINLSQIAVTKLSRQGKILWSGKFDFAQWGNTITCDKIVTDNDGRPVIAGTILNNSSQRMIYLVKTDSLEIATEVSKSRMSPEFSLMQNFPNPFNPVTTIKYSIPASGFVELKIYNVLGDQVSTLVSENQTAGEHTVRFNGGEMASGVYIYTIKAGEFRDSKKLLIMK